MQPDTGADVLLVTATKRESAAVLASFEQDSEPRPLALGDRVYFDLGTWGGARVLLTQCEMGSSGVGASQQAVTKAIAQVSPAAVLMVGIAFAVNAERQDIGDILVSQRLRPYELQRIGEAGEGSRITLLRDDKPTASAWLLNQLRSADVVWTGNAVKFGTLLTGDKLIDNVDYRDQLLEFEAEAIGGEMEGRGLYVACHDAKVDWIVVKSVCDFADGRKAEKKAARQTLAAESAASFVRHALTFVSVDWQARRAPSLQSQWAHRPERSTTSPRDRVLGGQLDQLDLISQLFEGKSELELRSDAGLDLLLEQNWVRTVEDYAEVVFNMVPAGSAERPRHRGMSLFNATGLSKYCRPSNSPLKEDAPPRSGPLWDKWEDYDFFKLDLPLQLTGLMDTVERISKNRHVPEDLARLLKEYNEALRANVTATWEVLEEVAAEYPELYPTFDDLKRAAPDYARSKTSQRRTALENPAKAVMDSVKDLVAAHYTEPGNADR